MAATLLKRLYSRYTNLKASKALASAALDDYAVAARGLYVQIASLQVEKRSLREHFGSGILNQKQYQAQLHTNWALGFIAEERLNGLFSEKFSGLLGRGFYFRERESVLKKIREMIHVR